MVIVNVGFQNNFLILRLPLAHQCISACSLTERHQVVEVGILMCSAMVWVISTYLRTL